MRSWPCSMCTQQYTPWHLDTMSGVTIAFGAPQTINAAASAGQIPHVSMLFEISGASPHMQASATSCKVPKGAVMA